MKNFKHATAGATASGDTEERALAHHPQHAPAVATPVVLTDAEAERFRNACLALCSLADELGLECVTIMAHNITAESAFAVFPDGKAENLSRSSVWDARVGRWHDVHLFTRGEVAS